MNSVKFEGEDPADQIPGSPDIEANSDDEYFSDDENGLDSHFAIELLDQRLVDSTSSKQASMAAVQAFAPDNGMLFVPPVQLMPNSWRIRGEQVDRYFNFGMDEVKWRLYVNKQIFMRMERILIEHKLQEDKEQHDLKRSKRHMRDRIPHSGYMPRYDAPYHYKSGGGYRGRNNYMGGGGGGGHRNHGRRYDQMQGYGGGGGGQHSQLPYPTFEGDETGEKTNRF